MVLCWWWFLWLSPSHVWPRSMIWLSHPLAALSKSDALVVTDWLKSQCVVPNQLRANVSAMATLQAFLNADRPRVMLLPAEFSAHSNANTRVRVPRCTHCVDIFVLLFAVDAHPILTANIVCGLTPQFRMFGIWRTLWGSLCLPLHHFFRIRISRETGVGLP